MKHITSIVIFLISCTLITCNSKKKDTTTYTSSMQYSEKELVSFLDSIGKLDPQDCIKEEPYWIDSILNSQTPLNITINNRYFEWLKKELGEDTELTEIDIELAKQLFPISDLKDYQNKVPIQFFPFREKFKEYAIAIGYVGDECDLYFYKDNRLISKHYVYYKYSLDMKHFVGEDGKTVILYAVNFASGSGIWWHQYNFYKYEGNSIIPILTEIKNSNCQSIGGPSRSFTIESEMINYNPLQLKFSYTDDFNFQIENTSPLQINNDSTIVTYNYDKVTKKYIPDFTNSKLNKYKLMSYQLISDHNLLFINTNCEALKNVIDSKDQAIKYPILAYLNEIKTYQQQ